MARRIINSKRYLCSYSQKSKDLTKSIAMGHKKKEGNETMRTSPPHEVHRADMMAFVCRNRPGILL